MPGRKYAVAEGCRAFGPGSTAWDNREVTWPAFVRRASSKARRIGTTRAEFDRMGKTEQGAMKNGPAFVGGPVDDGRHPSGYNVNSRSLLALDADYLADADLAALWRERVGAAAVTWSTTKSRPGKLRARVVSPLSRDVGRAEYRALAGAVMDALGASLFDGGSDQPERLMYWPAYCDDAEPDVLEIGGAPLDVDAWLDGVEIAPEPVRGGLGDPGEKPAVIGATCRAYTCDEGIDRYLADVYEATRGGRYTYVPGTAPGGLVVYNGGAWAYANDDTDPANTGHCVHVYDLLRIHLFGHLDADAKPGTPECSKPSYMAVNEMLLKDPAVVAELERARTEGARADFSDAAGDAGDAEADPDAWVLALGRNKRTGELLANAANVRAIIANDPEVAGRAAWDVRTLAPVARAGRLPWREVEADGEWMDIDDAGLRAWFDVKWGMCPTGKIADALDLEAFLHPYDPVREYLEGLPPWDGTPRVDTMLEDMIGAEPTPYARAVSRILLCAAVRRAKDPGCKYDQLVVLDGPQGCGKSSLVADLGGPFYVEGLTIKDMERGNKNAGEKIELAWFAELAELDGIGRASAETVKSWLSTRTDVYRNAYARRACKHPRRCVVVGTVNGSEGYLHDVTGNRRFYPVRVGGRYVPGSMGKAYRDQLFAEAVELEPHADLVLTGELAACAEREQREALEHDPREEIVREWLDAPVPVGFNRWDRAARELHEPATYKGPTELRAFACVTEVAHEALGMDDRRMDKRDSNGVANILRRLGWRPDGKRSVRAYGGSVRVYSRPEGDDPLLC